MSDFRLKVFQSVAKNLSFTKASQELFVSQPAITKHIQELETYYQARLFDRQGSKISLTKAGELLLKHSEKIRCIQVKIGVVAGIQIIGNRGQF